MSSLRERLISAIAYNAKNLQQLKEDKLTQDAITWIAQHKSFLASISDDTSDGIVTYKIQHA